MVELLRTNVDVLGPNKHYQKFIFDGPAYLVTECDGLRIITNETCEFLHRVPEATLEIFQIGSLEPAAMLYDAYTEFEEKDANSIKNIRAIKEEKKLDEAVKKCLTAAAHEFDRSLQGKLLQVCILYKSLY